MNVWNDRVEEAAHEAKLKAIWRKTHRDYKGKVGDVKTIMILRSGGSCLVALDDLTDEEVEWLL